MSPEATVEWKAFEKATGATLDVTIIPPSFETNVITKWAAGERPDILYWDAVLRWVVPLDPAKNLVPLNGMAFENKTLPGILNNGCTYKGELYCSVLDFPSINGMVYNAPLFKKLHLTIPTDFPQLLALCQSVLKNDPGVQPLTVGAATQFPLLWPMFISWNSLIKDTNGGIVNELNTGKVQWTDPRLVKGLQWEDTLLKDGCYGKDYLTTTFSDDATNIMTGKALMTFENQYFILDILGSYSLQAVAKTLGFFPISETGPVASWVEVGTGAVFVPKTTPAIEAAARDFINFATGPYYQTYINNTAYYPVLSGFTTPKNLPPVYTEMHRAFETDVVPHIENTLLAPLGNYYAGIAKMAAGEWTPLQMAQSLNTAFRQAAKAEGLPGF
jgi:raffinose/stachyose/melibiose transport system substrate-binding protein